MRVKWSQNFLADPNMARKCVDTLEVGPTDAVLEIGPGRGALTQLLMERAGTVSAVEIDPELAAGLVEKYRGDPRFSLINRDVLEADPERDLGLKGKSYKVIGNLPYAVTSPILQSILSWKGWTRAVVMVQKEVGERILAKPGGKDYGILSVSVQCKSLARKAFLVPRGCFRPMPNVDSMVLALEPLPKPLFSPVKEDRFFKVVKGCFAHRRKTILNSLGFEMDVSSENLRAAIDRAGLDPGARAETLTIADFKRLAEMVKSPDGKKSR